MHSRNISLRNAGASIMGFTERKPMANSRAVSRGRVSIAESPMVPRSMKSTHFRNESAMDTHRVNYNFEEGNDMGNTPKAKLTA